MSVFCCRTAIESCLTQVQWETNIYNPSKTPRSAEIVSEVLWIIFNVRCLAGYSHTACNTWYLARQASGEQAPKNTRPKKNREDCFA